MALFRRFGVLVLSVLSLAVHSVWQECMVEEVDIFTRGDGRKAKVRVRVLMSP